MHDTTLDELARRKPASLVDIRRVPGFGEKKTERYGQSVLEALAQFRKGARATPTRTASSDPGGETLALLAQGRTLEEIAHIRGRQLSTVASMVAGMVERGEVGFQPGWIHRDNQEKIEQACSQLGLERLRSLKNALPVEITYDDIRLVVAHLRHDRNA
jgi:ATP-dependent DNA helicase RecQ